MIEAEDGVNLCGECRYFREFSKFTSKPGFGSCRSYQNTIIFTNKHWTASQAAQNQPAAEIFSKCFMPILSVDPDPDQ